jgi:Cu+-exporting ATPase
MSDHGGLRRGGDMAVDPVCKMTVDEQQAAGTSEYGGTTYYFCSEGCRLEFEKDPQKYVRTQADG